MSDNSGNSRRPNDNKTPSAGQNVFWYLVVVGAAAFIVTMFFVNNVGHEISYYDFLRLIEASRLDEQGKPASSTPYIVVKTPIAEGRYKLTRYRNLRDLRNDMQIIGEAVDFQKLGRLPGQEPVAGATKLRGPRKNRLAFSFESSNRHPARRNSLAAAKTGGIPPAVQQRAGT